jgi:AraC-like DNA-binding protein
MLLFVSISIILIAVVAAIYNSKENRSTLYLSAILVNFATYSLTHYFTIYGKDPVMLAIFYGHFSPLWFLIGPLIYFYARSLFETKRSKIFWTDFLHFLPFFIQLFSVINYYFEPFSLKVELAKQVIENLNNLHQYDIINSLYSQNIAFFLRPAMLLIYSIYSLIYVLRKARTIQIEYYHWALFFLISMIGISLTFEILTIFVLLSKDLQSALLQSPFHFLSGLGFLCVPISIITLFPEIVYGKRSYKHKKKTNTSDASINLSFETTENELLAAKIIQYLDEQKPFLDPNFTLSDLEKGLEEDPEDIKICMKYILKKKFTELRSECRVEYAKQLLKNGSTKNTSIDGIGVLSGFSNRANFYSTFKLLTGLTPSEYLKTLNK